MPDLTPVSVALTAVSGVLGVAVGIAANRAAGRYPWTGDGGGPVVRPPGVELGTALLFLLTGLRFGWSWELPPFLLLAGVAVLLTLVDLQHRKLPNRVLVPAIAVGAVLLAVAAVATGNWHALLGAGLGAVVLFTVFLVLALASPKSLGMGDVKLAALLGLYLGWLGWDAVLLGAAAGFVVQAVVVLVLLAARKVTLRGELPFGPAMLLGAAVVIAWSGAPAP